MRTIKIDILNEKVLKILNELEKLELIKLHSQKKSITKNNWIHKYKGAMSLHSNTEIEKQLKDLRNGWE